jgi:hypothetical protein
MLRVVDLLPENYILDAYLFPAYPDYYASLQEKFKDHPKISILAPVPTAEIIATINKYDIGLFLLPPVNFNYLNALPNKFFEFIQARLAIAIGPSPEMAKYVHKYDLGVVSDDFTPDTMASAIAAIPIDKIIYYKSQSHLYANELSSTVDEAVILKEVKRVFSLNEK